jgi:formylglycine-generating enzyme required for sulfatase activity
MRHLVLVVSIGWLCACSAEEEPTWLRERPENAHPYAEETTARFWRLADGEAWDEPLWNEQGTQEVVHRRSGLAFVLVPGGEFRMGSPETEEGRQDNEGPQRLVRVAAFLLAKTECTQAAWDRVEELRGRDWRHFGEGESLPVHGVWWNVARDWCGRLGLRLPSEAEWEYACRAGSGERWCFGTNLATPGVRVDPPDRRPAGPDSTREPVRASRHARERLRVV